MSKLIEQTILMVLNDFAETQPNLASAAARKTIAAKVAKALYEKVPFDYPYNIEFGSGRTKEEMDAMQADIIKTDLKE